MEKESKDVSNYHKRLKRLELESTKSQELSATLSKDCDLKYKALEGFVNEEVGKNIEAKHSMQTK